MDALSNPATAVLDNGRHEESSEKRSDSFPRRHRAATLDLSRRFSVFRELKRKN